MRVSISLSPVYLDQRVFDISFLPLTFGKLPQLPDTLDTSDSPCFFHPSLDVLSIRIVIVSLLDRIKCPASTAPRARIVAYACDICPVAPVARRIVVDEPALVPFCSESPVETKVFGEEGGYVLACAIGGIPCEEQFALGCIDEAR